MHRHTSPPLRRFGGHGLTDSRTHRLTRRTPSPATASLLAPKDPKRESQATTRAHLPTFGALEHRNRPLVSSPLRPSPKSYRRSIPQSLSVSEASRHAVQFLRYVLLRCRGSASLSCDGPTPRNLSRGVRCMIHYPLYDQQPAPGSGAKAICLGIPCLRRS